MVEIFSLSKESFGLEITDATVRLMKLKRRGKNIRVVSVAVAPIPAGVMKGGDIKDEEKLTAAIKEAFGKVAGEKIKTRQAVVSLPENKAFLQVIKMPKLKIQDLRAAVVFEAENYIPLPLEKVYLDFEVVADVFAENSTSCEVMIAALPRDPVDAVIRAISKAGLVPVAMELESQAILRALSMERQLESPTIMVHIGDTKTNIIIYSDNSIRFTFSIPISNRYFLDMIAKNVGVGLEEAAELKRNCGIEEFANQANDIDLELTGRDNDRQKIMKRAKQEENFERQKIFEALIPGLVDFIQQIKKCVTYYQTHYSGRSAAKDGMGRILLCGSGSDLKGIDDFIAMKLGTSVERASLPATKGILEELGEGNGLCRESCGFAVVFGLALRALDATGGLSGSMAKNKKNVPVPIPKPLVSKKRISVKKN